MTWATFDPMKARIEELRKQAEGDPALAETLAESETEIEMFRRFGDQYGYTFYVLQRGD